VTTALLAMDGVLFDKMIEQLAARGHGVREAGAFLLADREDLAGRRPQLVTAVAYYDDLDPGCLNGAIEFTANGYTALAGVCRREGLRVVGDVHTHPKHRVAQSPTDASHPMVALDGHVAVIVPRYATGTVTPADLGVHVRHNGTWTSRYGPAAVALIEVRRMRLTLRARIARGVRNYLNRVRRTS